MKKSTKIWFIAAGAAIFAGLCICGAVLGISLKNGEQEIAGYYQQNRYEIKQDFSNITIETAASDIRFVLSEDGSCSVVCSGPQDMQHEVSARDGELKICLKDTGKWYEHMHVNFRGSAITVSLPEKSYAALNVRTNTGDVKIPSDFVFESIAIQGNTGEIDCNASVAGALEIQMTTGEIDLEDMTAGEILCNLTSGETELENVKCGSFASDGKTGDISLERVLAEGKLSINRSTGEVELKACDAPEIEITTSTGDVKGTLLTGKLFSVETGTGDVRVPENTDGGSCRISTKTGDISIRIA